MASETYALYDASCTRLNGRTVHKLHRLMVNTMLMGKCTSVDKDISVGNLTIPQDLHVFTNSAKRCALLFCKVPATGPVMLFLDGDEPYIFTDDPRFKSAAGHILRELAEKNVSYDTIADALPASTDSSDSDSHDTDEEDVDAKDKPKKPKKSTPKKSKKPKTPEPKKTPESPKPKPKKPEPKKPKKPEPPKPEPKPNETTGTFLQFYEGNFNITTFPTSDISKGFPKHQQCFWKDIQKWKKDSPDMQKYLLWRWLLPSFYTSHWIPGISPQEVQQIKESPTAMRTAEEIYEWFVEYMGAVLDTNTGVIFPSDEFEKNKWHKNENEKINRLSEVFAWLSLFGLRKYVLPLYLFCRCHFEESFDVSTKVSVYEVWRRRFDNTESRSTVDAVESYVKDCGFDTNTDKPLMYIEMILQLYPEATKPGRLRTPPTPPRMKTPPTPPRTKTPPKSPTPPRTKTPPKSPTPPKTPPQLTKEERRKLMHEFSEYCKQLDRDKRLDLSDMEKQMTDGRVDAVIFKLKQTIADFNLQESRFGQLLRFKIMMKTLQYMLDCAIVHTVTIQPPEVAEDPSRLETCKLFCQKFNESVEEIGKNCRSRNFDEAKRLLALATNQRIEHAEFSDILEFRLIEPKLKLMNEMIKVTENGPPEEEEEEEEDEDGEEKEVEKGGDGPAVEMKIEETPAVDIKEKENDAGVAAIRTGSICRQVGTSDNRLLVVAPSLLPEKVSAAPGAQEKQYRAWVLDDVLKMDEEYCEMVYLRALTVVPDNELTPLQVACRRTFDPNNELRAVGIRGPNMNVKDMDKTIMSLPAKDLLILNAVKGVYEFPDDITWAHVRDVVHSKTGLFRDDTFSGAVIPILCRMYGGVVCKSTAPQIRAYFERQSSANKPKVFVLDSRQLHLWNNGTSVFNQKKDPQSPRWRKSEHIRRLNLAAFDFIILPISNELRNETGKVTRPGNHWYMGCIDIKKGCVRLLDSLNGNDSQDISTQNTHISHHHALAAYAKNLFALKNDTAKDLMSPFGTKLTEAEKEDLSKYARNSHFVRWIEEKPLPPQNNGIDCGVFVSMYMAYYMSGNVDEIRTDVTMENIPRFRECLTRLICETETGAPIRVPGPPSAPGSPVEIVGETTS